MPMMQRIAMFMRVFVGPFRRMNMVRFPAIVTIRNMLHFGFNRTQSLLESLICLGTQFHGSPNFEGRVLQSQTNQYLGYLFIRLNVFQVVSYPVFKSYGYFLQFVHQVTFHDRMALKTLLDIARNIKRLRSASFENMPFSRSLTVSFFRPALS